MQLPVREHTRAWLIMPWWKSWGKKPPCYALASLPSLLQVYNQCYSIGFLATPLPNMAFLNPGDWTQGLSSAKHSLLLLNPQLGTFMFQEGEKSSEAIFSLGSLMFKIVSEESTRQPLSPVTPPRLGRNRAKDKSPSNTSVKQMKIKLGRKTSVVIYNSFSLERLKQVTSKAGVYGWLTIPTWQTNISQHSMKDPLLMLRQNKQLNATYKHEKIVFGIQLSHCSIQYDSQIHSPYWVWPPKIYIQQEGPNPRCCTVDQLDTKSSIEEENNLYKSFSEHRKPKSITTLCVVILF